MRKIYFILFITLLFIEVAITFTSGFIRHTFGDFLVVILLYCLIKSFINISKLKAAALVLLIAYFIEIIQLTNISELEIFNKFPFLKLIFGTTFQWTDLVAYSLGIAFVLFIENFLMAKNNYLVFKIKLIMKTILLTLFFSFLFINTAISQTANPVNDLEICDNDSDGDDTNGFVQDIVLNVQTSIILGSQDPTDYTVTYHTSASDATNGINPIDSSNPYTNIIANAQTIYARVTDNANTSNFDTTSFNIIINPLPVVTSSVELKQCDDDTDGFATFNLNDATSDISANFANETFVFYPTLTDAQADTNSIANSTTFTNTTVTTDKVWARTISLDGCFRISEVTLTVSTTAIPSSFQRSFTECDDFLDNDGNDTANNDDTDGISTFNFSSVTSEILALFPVSQQLTIAYYRNQSDAIAEVNAINDPSNYRNIGSPNTQQIYVRVNSDLDNNCLGIGTHITLNVGPVPLAGTSPNLAYCDNASDGDGNNGIIQNINLEMQTALILGSQNPTDYTVTYHTSALDALTGSNAITSTSAYTNITPNTQTIFVRVTNNTTSCFTSHTSFNIIVTSLPTANFTTDLEVCDDNSDGSAQNGFSQSFNLESQTAAILGTQSPASFSVTYHLSLANAQAGINSLGSPFSNTVPFSQTIYVRVTNFLTNCVNTTSNFNVIVNPQPTTQNISNLVYCDNDADGDDTNGIVQNIDLDSMIQPILGDPSIQDEDDFTVTFHQSQADATSGTNQLSSPYENTIANQQTIYVRVLNNDSGCVNDDFSFSIIIEDCADMDSDNVPDSAEDVNGNGNLSDDDTDNNTVPNYLDDDDDGDGVLTIDEDYNNNGDPTDDDINMNNIPDYLDSAVTLGNTEVESFNFLVYPNPSNEFIKIQLTNYSESNLTIHVYTIQGKTVLKKQFSRNNLDPEIDISKIVNGVYFIKIENNKGSITKKLIVNHN
ncbi:MAG: DUF2809 domain-containing protein [Flavobacteriaceae bacterium]